MGTFNNYFRRRQNNFRAAAAFRRPAIARSHHEEAHQVQVANFLRSNYPEVLFTISPIVKVSPFLAKKLKAMGYTAGTPDLIIFYPKGAFHGLMIELKTPKSIYTSKGTVSEKQSAFLEKLNSLGYKAIVCYGAAEAEQAIKEYMLL
jgi:hypothetical protein